MEKTFDGIVYSAFKFGLLNLDAKFDQTVGVVLNKEFASAGLCVLVSDTLNLRSECLPGHGEP